MQFKDNYYNMQKIHKDNGKEVIIPLGPDSWKKNWNQQNCLTIIGPYYNRPVLS